MPSSDEATLTQYWIRRGDILTWVTIAYDPLYLAEPMIRSSEYRFSPNQQIPPYPCTPVEEVDRAQGVVPHYLPGTQSVSEGVRREIQPPDRGHARRPGQHVSRSGAQDSSGRANGVK